jgi:hypothetical protein
MSRFLTSAAVTLAANLLVIIPASAQGFTIINPNGGTVERSRSVSANQLDRSVERTTANGRTRERDITLQRTGAGEASRTVTGSGSNGHGATRGSTISR